MLSWPVPTLRRSGLLAVLAAAGAALSLWPSLQSLHQIWVGVFDYQHGYLIAAVSIGWLVFVASKLSLQPRPSLLGSALLAAVLYAWLIAFNANSVVLHQMLLPVAVWSAVFAATGWGIARKTLAPVAFLYFAIPIWELALPVLQLFSVVATENLLSLLGVPAKVSEYTVRIPEGTFQIIEGCSGKRYFMVTLALGTLAGLLNGMRHGRLAVFVAVCGALSMLANWIRIVVVIYIGHVSNMQHYIVAVEHRTFGHAVFIVLMIAVLLLARRMAPPTQREAKVASSESSNTFAAPWRVAVPLVLLMATVGVTQARTSASQQEAALGSFPVAADAWQGPMPAGRDWSPVFAEPDGHRQVGYRSSDGAVEVYAAAYAEQRQGRELVHEGNTVLAPGWTRSWPERTTALTTGAAPLASFEARASDGSLWLLAYTFEVGGRRTTSEPFAQLMYGLQSFVKPAPSGVLALASRCNENCERARALVMSFWDDMSVPLLDVVPDGGQSR
jgi:EpsI family protein